MNGKTYVQVIKTSSLGLAAVLLTACNEVYDKPDTGYGYRGVSDSRLVNNCQYQVDNRIERKFDRRVAVQYDYVDIEDISRNSARVRGDAVIRDRGNRLRLKYHCDLNIETGRVNDVDIKWIDKPYQEQDTINPGLLRACQDTVRKQVKRDTAVAVSLEFRDYKTESLSRHRSQVTGKAKIRADHGDGQIRYECVVNSKHNQMEQASYRWTQSLPSNDKKVKKACHEVIHNQIKGDGYKKVNFKTSEVKNLSKTDRSVRGTVGMRRSGNKYQASYECRVNIRNDQVVKGKYWLN